MRIKLKIKTAFLGLWNNKIRATLTVLGITIGIAAVVMILSLGKGTEALIIGEVNQLGTESLVVQAGSDYSDAGAFTDSILDDRGLNALKRKENVPFLKRISPLVLISGDVTYQGETYRPEIYGTDGEYFADVFDAYPKEGRMYDEQDIEAREKVAVIGVNIVDELFGATDPIGEYVKISNHRFRVVGIFPKKGQVVFSNVDDLVIVPHTTAQTYLTGDDSYFEFLIQAESVELVDRTAYDVEQTMYEVYDIDDPDDAPFKVQTQQGLVEQISVIVNILTIFLSAVVGISLVVGGVGIMNIMLVSVTERTREIGLRKALGATEKDISDQFLYESVMLTSFGGIAGIVIGTLMSMLISVGIAQFALTNWTFEFSFGGAILGLVISAAVGIIFGLYPARKAAKKSPVDALRYE